jgi:hypothetical protein
MTIRGVPDLNGNGQPDVVGGTQLLYGGTGGDVYALEGNANPTAVIVGADPGHLLLSPACPNPATGPVQWQLHAREPGHVRMLVFGPDGRLVSDLGEWPVGAGDGLALHWNGRDALGQPVAAGVYHARLLFDGRAVVESRIVRIR